MGKRARVPAEERVFSLILALVASPQGLTKSELFSSVHGYSDRYRPGELDTSLERQFERDKEQVRELGVPIETLDSPLEPGNNQLTRYRIAKQRLQLPEQLRFTAEEISMLRLAALSWSDGSLSDESRWARMKLISLGANIEVAKIGVAPKLGMAEPSAPALQRGIDEIKYVSFDYQLPSRSEPLGRTVAPLRLHLAESRWHLVAFDKDRQDFRVFLLSRISSPVKVSSTRYDESLVDGVEGVLADLLSVRARLRARISARPGSAAEARLALRSRAEISSGQDGAWPVMELGTLDLHEFALELAGFGDEVIVHEPAELRDEVIRVLKGVRFSHAAPIEQGDDDV